MINTGLLKLWHPGIKDGRKWRPREEMGGKTSSTRAEIGVFPLIMVKNGPKRAEMDHKRLKIAYLKSFFCGTYAEFFGGKRSE